MMATYDLQDARADHPLWFERDAMQFFGTRLGRSYVGDGYCYLVTSEQPPHGPRTYNVRRFDRDHCDTIGPRISEGWETRTRAQSVARALIGAETDGWIRRRTEDTFKPCDHCIRSAKEYPGWAAFEVSHPTDPEMSGLYCDDHIPAVVGYDRAEMTV